MNLRQLIPVAVAAVVFGVGGYQFGRLGSETAPPPRAVNIHPKPAPAVSTPDRPSGDGSVPMPESIAEILGDAPLSGANASAVAYRALEEADPVNRMAATTVLLASMTPSNAKAIFQAFVDITKRTGRKHDTEWALMLKRYGEVAGVAGLEDVAGNPHSLGSFIEGMAAADPDGTLAALTASGIDPAPYSTAWLTGICRKDPEKAMRLALSGKYQSIDARSLLNQAIQTSGLDGAREALQVAIDSAGDETAGDPVFIGLFNSFADNLFHKHATTGTVGEMLKWIEQQKGQPYLSDQLIDRAARESFLKGDRAETLAWLGRINAGEDHSAGSTGLYEAASSDPNIIGEMDDATFAQLLPMLPKDPAKLEFFAVALRSTNPARAEQFHAAVAATRVVEGQPNPSGAAPPGTEDPPGTRPDQ
jgi:hypothetical protein